MKKLLAVLLACTMLAGTMSVSVFAANTAEGTGSMTVTGKTGPELPDPKNPDIDYPIPTDPVVPGDDETTWAKLYHKDLVFEPGKVADIKNTNRKSVVSNDVLTKKQLGIILEDYTGLPDAKWKLSLQAGKFMLKEKPAVEGIPGAELIFSSGKIIKDPNNLDQVGKEPSPVTDLTLDAGHATAVVLATSNTNPYGSPGHWLGLWDVELGIKDTVSPGQSIATMTWTITAGL